MPLPHLDDHERLPELRRSHDLVDLHFHTHWSDGLAAPGHAVASARRLGVRVAITDHNVIEGALEAWRLAGDEAAQLIVPGIEITTAERIHLLVYFRRPDDLHHFFHRHVVPFRPRGATATTAIPRPAADFLDVLRRYEHLTSAAHPFAVAKNGLMSVREQFAQIRELVGELDAVEVVNGEELDGGNRQAADLARRTHLGSTAGSDGHTLRELGSVCMAIERGADLFECVRHRHAMLVDQRLPGTWRRLLAHSAKAPYFARRPGRFAVRWARHQSGDGPLTRAIVGADELSIDSTVPDPATDPP